MKWAIALLVLIILPINVVAKQVNKLENNPLPRKTIHVSREELIQEHLTTHINCDLGAGLLRDLIYSVEPVTTKPNRYIFTFLKMDLNDIYCQFKNTEMTTKN